MHDFLIHRFDNDSKLGTKEGASSSGVSIQLAERLVLLDNCACSLGDLIIAECTFALGLNKSIICTFGFRMVTFAAGEIHQQLFHQQHQTKPKTERLDVTPK